MASWAQRMHRRAADLGSVVTSCGHPGPGPYPHRLEKVKFGVALDEVCKKDIPGPLLVLILKLNKEAPQRENVFRAPGHQGAMKKLIHFLQAGRLVNVDNYSVYTIASVLKKFLRKIPNGIFGREGEAELFAIVELSDEAEQQERIHRLITSLPIYTQRLLVLLFGTFRVIASNAERAGTGMTSEALGVSVAPSFFQSCVSDGKTARMEDVLRFKATTRIMKQMIDQFATCDLFGRGNYEYYARVTGRILKVQDEWICSFQYPPPPRVELSLEAGKTWLQCECERWGLIAQEESQSTPALLTSSSSAIGNSALSLGIIPEHSLLESCARLSVSLEGPGVFAIAATTSSQSSNKNQGHESHSNSNGSNGGCGGGLVGTTADSNGLKSSSSCSSTRSSKSASAASHHHMTMDELRAVNRYAESTKSLSYLPQVHERQTARMRTRSEWFLGNRGGSLELAGTCAGCHQYFGGSTNDLNQHHVGISNLNLLFLLETVGNIGLSASAESVHYPVKRPSRRGPSTARHHPHRSSSRRNKENGKSHVSTTVAAAGAVTTTICGAGSTSTGCRTTSGTSSGQHQQHRSNSFRQKKSNSLLTDCSSCTSSNNTNSKLRKPRAVSFESKETTTTCVNISNLMQNIKTSSSSNSDVIVEVMDTTPPPPEIIEPFHSQMSSASSTTISGTLTTPLILPTTTSPSTGLHETQHTSYMHFKPPRL
ncbi:unnamed protein product [Hermetia illucens]|uniref:Rho-GAP domain-containing protein n=1 Tax=Hermetia illucens TaxID=343691 RepID=A0A7R8UI01_HERIL|nr:unnamed protein product [Hermetia illucens]